MNNSDVQQPKHDNKIETNSSILDSTLAIDDIEYIALVILLIIVTFGFALQEIILRLINKKIQTEGMILFARYIIHVAYSIVYGSLFILIYRLGISISYILYGCLIYLGLLVLIFCIILLYKQFKKKKKTN